MAYYFAPMEGLTDSVYRRLHHKYFPGVDRYYMPFISPTVHRTLTPRERRELPPAASEDFVAVPQLLTKNAEDFRWAAEQCAIQGYDEVNLNLGCPSGTVVSKGKGAGMLRDLDALERFLDEIFRESALPISLKTRLGLENPDEFPAILDILNRYPAKLLILHPRVRKQFYKGDIAFDSFDYCLEHSRIPVCYNGDLRTRKDLAEFRASYPQVEDVMIGRGLIGDPGLLVPEGTDVEALQHFTDDLLFTYRDIFGSERNAMFRMKENWALLLTNFADSEKLGKRLRKTTDYGEFREITAQIFSTLSFASQEG